MSLGELVGLNCSGGCRRRRRERFAAELNDFSRMSCLRLEHRRNTALLDQTWYSLNGTHSERHILAFSTHFVAAAAATAAAASTYERERFYAKADPKRISATELGITASWS